MAEKKTPMRQSHIASGRKVGDPWRIPSPYPVFDIFRADIIRDVTDYSKLYLREIAVARAPVPDRLVEGMLEYTGWSVERLFGAEFKKEWEVDHKDNNNND